MHQGQVFFYRDYQGKRVDVLTIEITEMNFIPFPRIKILLLTHPMPETDKMKKMLEKLEFLFSAVFETEFYCDPAYFNEATKSLSSIMQVALQLLDKMPNYCLDGNVSSYPETKIITRQIENGVPNELGFPYHIGLVKEEKDILLHQFGFQIIKDISMDAVINRFELICAEFQKVGTSQHLDIKIEIKAK